MMCGAADSWWPSRGRRERGSKQIGRAARGIQGSGCHFQGMAGKRARLQLSEIKTSDCRCFFLAAPTAKYVLTMNAHC